MASCLSGYLTRRLFAGMVRKIAAEPLPADSDRWVVDENGPGRAKRGPVREDPFTRAAESACEAVEGLEPGSPADAGASRDRQPGRDLTLSSVRGYESGVLRVKKEIPE